MLLWPRMHGVELQSLVAKALLSYVLFIPLLTFHEWAHAWVAWKCGDDTAYERGRVSLNPIVHMELIGTVVLPIAGLIMGAMGAGFMIFGWGKPVPVDIRNLKHPRLQDTLIAMAGPAINLVLAFILVGLVKVGIITRQPWLGDLAYDMAGLSLVLCFFNLLPVPPLDGSHLILNIFRMSYETYYRFAQAGFIIILVLLQFDFIHRLLGFAINGTIILFARIFGALGLDKM